MKKTRPCAAARNLASNAASLPTLTSGPGACASAGRLLPVPRPRLSAAASALDEIARRPRPEIDADGLKQVIDVFWEAARLAAPKGEPAKYMDLSYLHKARR